MRTLRPILVFATLILGVPAIGSEEIQLTNWPAPLFWQPGAEATSGGGETRTADGGKRHALALPSGPLPFVAITPCRIADTRGNGFTGADGPGTRDDPAGRTLLPRRSTGRERGARTRARPSAAESMA